MIAVTSKVPKKMLKNVPTRDEFAGLRLIYSKRSLV